MPNLIIDESRIHGTITNMRDAQNAVSVIWDKILKAPLGLQYCNCQIPLCFGSLMSYDHDSGAKVPGYAAPQWFVIHCFKCGYDTNIYKIGIHRGELEEFFNNSLTCSQCASFRNTKLIWCVEDKNRTTPENKACFHFQYREPNQLF
jgi:hypothetical protein